MSRKGDFCGILDLREAVGRIAMPQGIVRPDSEHWLAVADYSNSASTGKVMRTSVPCPLSAFRNSTVPFNWRVTQHRAQDTRSGKNAVFKALNSKLLSPAFLILHKDAYHEPKSSGGSG